MPSGQPSNTKEVSERDNEEHLSSSEPSQAMNQLSDGSFDKFVAGSSVDSSMCSMLDNAASEYGTDLYS